MTEAAPVNLIDLGDADGNRCVVRVTGRYQPGVLTGHDILQADVLVSASLAGGFAGQDGCISASRRPGRRRRIRQ
ncbi:DUF5959 family protein [Streptomyces sp. NPDC059496]|uniref:DUF5959 family protein n=1 Tax=Streptomyces sp. NPDC059496 TaxID=3346851 RepID=UPI0036CCE1D4